MPYIKEGPYKLKVNISVNAFARVGCHLGQLRHRSPNSPTDNTASFDSHEIINLLVSFFFRIWVWGSAWRLLGPRELRYNLKLTLEFSIAFPIGR